MNIEAPKPSFAEREIARRRRFSAWLLAVGLTAGIVALSRQPSLLPFLLANIGLGILFGFFSVRDPIPFPASNRSMIGFVGFLVGLRVLEAIFLARGDVGPWQGATAAFVGFAILQLFTARRAVERWQGWWAEQVAALGPPPSVKSFRERWDWQLRFEARFLSRTAARAYFVVACLMTLAAILGLLLQVWIAGVLLVIGLLSIGYFSQLRRLKSRHT